MWHRSSRQERGYGRSWEILRQHALQRDQFLCVSCRKQGITQIAKDVDHIIPKVKGGTDALDNLQSLCRPCHERKTIQEKGGTPKAAIGMDGWPIGT